MAQAPLVGTTGLVPPNKKNCRSHRVFRPAGIPLLPPCLRSSDLRPRLLRSVSCLRFPSRVLGLPLFNYDSDSQTPPFPVRSLRVYHLYRLAASRLVSSCLNSVSITGYFSRASRAILSTRSSLSSVVVSPSSSRTNRNRAINSLELSL